MNRKYIFIFLASFGALTTSAPVHSFGQTTSTIVPNGTVGCDSTWGTVATSCSGSGNCDVGCAANCGGCNGGCGLGSVGCSGGYFANLLKRSDQSFSDFISPMTNPVFFEDPRNLTEARFIFMNHRVPPGAGGGDVQLYALQIRARLSDNVSLIATKDGYVKSTNALVGDGWADISAGLKFNLLRDATAGRMLSAGFTYELPSGESAPLQGNGDGELNTFISGARRIGCRSHWISVAGWRIPFDSDTESESMYFSNHFDYQLTNRFYALTEFNWYHWLDSGSGGINGVEGLDLFNLGSTGVTGNDIVTGAAGAKFKANQNTEFGVAWEFPLTNRRDIIQDRFTVDLIVRY